MLREYGIGRLGDGVEIGVNLLPCRARVGSEVGLDREWIYSLVGWRGELQSGTSAGIREWGDF